MKRLIFCIIPIIILIVFASCGRRPRYVLPESKMMDVLYDIQMVQAIYRNNRDFGTDPQKDALVDAVLRKHKITQVQLDSSLLWYSDNIEYYEIINDSVASRLKKQSEALNAARLASTSQRRSKDELIPSIFHMDEYRPTMSFNIDSIKIKNIDLPKFNLKFEVQGLNAMQQLEAAVFYTYKDTLVENIIPIDKNTLYTINKPQLADSLLKSITGYIHFRSKVKDIPANIVLYNISYIDSLSIEVDSLNTELVSFKADEPQKNIASDFELTEPAQQIQAHDLPLVPDVTEKKDKPLTINQETKRSPITRRERKLDTSSTLKTD